jgi:hypothetical protein
MQTLTELPPLVDAPIAKLWTEAESDAATEPEASQAEPEPIAKPAPTEPTLLSTVAAEPVAAQAVAAQAPIDIDSPLSESSLEDETEGDDCAASDPDVHNEEEELWLCICRHGDNHTRRTCPQSGWRREEEAKSAAKFDSSTKQSCIPLAAASAHSSASDSVDSDVEVSGDEVEETVENGVRVIRIWGAIGQPCSYKRKWRVPPCAESEAEARVDNLDASEDDNIVDVDTQRFVPSHMHAHTLTHAHTPTGSCPLLLLLWDLCFALLIMPAQTLTRSSLN